MFEAVLVAPTLVHFVPEIIDPDASNGLNNKAREIALIRQRMRMGSFIHLSD
jgi:hypothetical protein